MSKFSENIEKLITTPAGKEASMYGAISNIFTETLGYSVRDVDIDSSGHGGRPDVAVKAESGLLDSGGKPVRINWIVIEAKDEKGAFSDLSNREAIFEEKSKYIGPNTAWFVMVDPTIIVARPVYGRATSGGSDMCRVLDRHLTEDDFKLTFHFLNKSVAGVPEQLKRFRSGDKSLISIEKLENHGKTGKLSEKRLKLARRNFFEALRQSIVALQDACRLALREESSDIEMYKRMAEEFKERWGGYEFDSQTLSVKGRNRERKTVREHNRDAATLRQAFAKNPSIARLALDGLPNFQRRTGCDNEILHELFAIESANLILARVLLLRFFEDHDFFGKRKYVCNGGVEAFQKMREYFDVGYTKLLREAYQSASRLYDSAFGETELDWVVGINNPNLSNAIEWTLFQFSKFDFTTVRGDVLTGIYDRFLDRDQRKKLGEFYTPPAIARYIVERVGISGDSTVIDPACGSGTFLIEAYHKMIGDDAERGAADYDDILDAFERINGNDLNVFSSVLSQIQLLWQILRFKKDIEQKKGFPAIHITGKVNSLVVGDLLSSLDAFSIMDDRIYDAVIGNPPYVRAERSAQELDKATEQYFSKGGISPKANAFTLFLYRALDSWCKPPDENGKAGKVGFILPVSLFDNNDNSDIRKLFEIGGRWTIKEIVDMELIWKFVFDAKTLPAIFIAEARPATVNDIVQTRIAVRSCITIEEDATRPTLDIDALPVEHIPYSDIFTPDGRILTRITEKRLPLLKKLWANQTFEDIAKPYWVRKEGARIVEWTDRSTGINRGNWESKKMLAGGLAFRGHKPKTSKGFDVYKGENIVACDIQGDLIETNIDIAALSDSSLWRYLDILPNQALAVAQIAHCPNGVLFNPHDVAFMNTATIFIPEDRLANFPFDLLLMSNVYVFFYALAVRMGVLDALRGHVYPSNFGLLPWNDTMVSRADEIEAMRPVIIESCEKVFNAQTKLDGAISASFKALKEVLKARKNARIIWSETFEMAEHTAEITKVEVSDKEDASMIFLSQNLFDWVEINDRSVARGLATAMKLSIGKQLKKDEIMSLRIPVGNDELPLWDSIVAAHSTEAAGEEMSNALNKLDRVVGRCLGLKEADIDFIQEDIRSDGFLNKIKPRYPGKITRKQGFRTGLDSSERYR